MEAEGLIVELAVSVWFLPKAEPQTELGGRWLIWEVIPRSTNKDVEGDREKCQRGVLAPECTAHPELPR